MRQRYLIALGSNVRHARHGPPAAVVRAALTALAGVGIKVLRQSRLMQTVPLGPSRRRYANSAAVIETALGPDDLLDLLKTIEQRFGRRVGGQRWLARVLDLDIILWGPGAWVSNGLTIPHPQFRNRAFVLGPAHLIAPDWRDPLSALSLRQLHARLTRPRPAPR